MLEYFKEMIIRRKLPECSEMFRNVIWITKQNSDSFMGDTFNLTNSKIGFDCIPVCDDATL